MLCDLGCSWENEPDAFRIGTFLMRKSFDVVLSEDERMRIPEKHRPMENTLVTRTRTTEIYFDDVLKFFE